MTTKELEERLVAAEKALAVLSNTLHVVDAASVLAVYSLIETGNLRQPAFKSKKDIIESGCSGAINEILGTIIEMNKADSKEEVEEKHEEDESEGR